MSSRWYYQLMIEEFGPVTVEQLQDLVESGTLSDGDLVRQESSEVWIPISDVRQSLFVDGNDDLPSLNEEIGDLSELAFEFEDSGPTTKRGAYSEDVDADGSPSIQTSTPIVPTSLSATSSPPATPPQESLPPALEEVREEWFCESLGQVMGPMSFEELIELGKGGALDANDRVKCGERGAWKIVEHLPSVMRAVALSRTIEIDPQTVSSTTQKRLGDAAYAAMVNSPEVSEAPTAPQPQLQPSTPKAASPTTSKVAAAPADLPQPNENASATESAKPSPEKSKATKSRPKRRKSAKGEDKLLDEIFDDVFNDDNAPAISNKPMHSIAAASVNPQAPPYNSVPQNPTAAPSYSASSASTSVGSNSSGSNAAGLAAAAMAARSVTSSKSSRPSVKIDPKSIGIFVAILLVGACGYYVWQNGLPFMGSPNGSGNFDRAGAVKVLEAAMARYKAVGSSPSDAEWKEFSVKTKLEMSALFKSVYDRAGATPQGAECLASIMCLMKIAGTTPGNTELIDKNVEEFQKHIVLVTK